MREGASITDAGESLNGMPGALKDSVGGAMKKTEVLVVDDDHETRDLVSEVLQRQGMHVTASPSASDALRTLRDGGAAIDVVVTDIAMPDTNGIDLCTQSLQAYPDIPVVIITGYANVDTATNALRAGAFDFLTKPIDPKTLGLVTSRAAHHRELRAALEAMRSGQADSSNRDAIAVGTSSSMKKLADRIDRVGDSDASVLIHGETGTGKELVAHAVHTKSKRRDGPFVAINCAAVPHALLESELFGHARGAFTDAKTARTGLFVQASGGTLFLDEIGELPIDMQPKLLRALQERKVRPVGDNREYPYDARIVAATNRDLEREVRERRFREDLYYRINVVKLEIPPLRSRGADTLRLAYHFLQQFAERSGKPSLTLSERAAERLLCYEWPGNVRELENTIEHAVALARFNQITVEDLPEKLRGYNSGDSASMDREPSEMITMDELEKRYLLRVFHMLGQNKSRAAELLGIDRRTMYRKLERYALGTVSNAPMSANASTAPNEPAGLSDSTDPSRLTSTAPNPHPASFDSVPRAMRTRPDEADALDPAAPPAPFAEEAAQA